MKPSLVRVLEDVACLLLSFGKSSIRRQERVPPLTTTWQSSESSVGFDSTKKQGNNNGAIPKIICHAANIAGASCMDRALTSTLAKAALAAPTTTATPPQKASGPLNPSNREQISVTPPNATIAPPSFCKRNGSSGWHPVGELHAKNWNCCLQHCSGTKC